MVRVWLSLWLLFVTGCSTVFREPLSVSTLAGEYTNGDPFSPRVLRLDALGTFSYDQFTDVLVTRADDTSVFQGSWGMRGSWAFDGPDTITLTGPPGALSIKLHIRRKPDGKLVLLEPELFPAALKEWPDVRPFSYLERRK